MNWGKKVNVPLEHKEFTASYRAGHSDALKGHQKLPKSYFSRSEAEASYLAGYEIGQQERQREAQSSEKRSGAA